MATKFAVTKKAATAIETMHEASQRTATLKALMALKEAELPAIAKRARLSQKETLAALRHIKRLGLGRYVN